MDKNPVGFGCSAEVFNGKYEEMVSNVDTKSAIVNKSYGFTPPVLNTSTQYKNSVSLIDINKNNNDNHQGLIGTTKTTLFTRTMILSNRVQGP